MAVLWFPESLYGPTAQVRATVGKRATKVLRDDSLESLVREPRIDVSSYPGLIVLVRGRGGPPSAEASFHADLLWRELTNRVIKKVKGHDAIISRLTRIAASALTEPWWFAGLLRSDSYFLVSRASQQLAFLEHARAHWEVLVSASGRYDPTPRLEEAPTLVSYCLARQGAPLSMLQRRQLTPAMLEKLLDGLPGRHVRSLAANGKHLDAARLIAGHEDVTALSLAEHLVDCGQDALACQTVRDLNLPDPHGIVANWLAREGDPARRVR